jgi:hypothetical protein
MGSRTIGVSLAVLLLTFVLTLVVSAGVAGDLEPSAPPDSTSSYTLEDIYNRLNDGTEATARTFTEPSSGPGLGTMRTLNEIYELAGERAPVPRTGQTASDGAKDDGDLQRGVAWPDPRFTGNGDGTVTDNLTGLIWLENANCFGTRTWEQALLDANTLNSGECGLADGSSEGDWRLPNVRELYSLVDYGHYLPVLPSGHPFTGVESWYYWSSTASAGYESYAWTVVLAYGSVIGVPESNTHHVWPVRGGH